jgi:hypothetical protein
MKITKFVALEQDMVVIHNGRYSSKCPQIEVTKLFVDLNAERIACLER